MFEEQTTFVNIFILLLNMDDFLPINSLIGTLLLLLQLSVWHYSSIIQSLFADKDKKKKKKGTLRV